MSAPDNSESLSAIKLGASMATPISLSVTSPALTSVRELAVETKYFRLVMSETKIAGSSPLFPSLISKAIPSGLASIPRTFI